MPASCSVDAHALSTKLLGWMQVQNPCRERKKPIALRGPCAAGNHTDRAHRQRDDECGFGSRCFGCDRRREPTDGNTQKTGYPPGA